MVQPNLHPPQNYAAHLSKAALPQRTLYDEVGVLQVPALQFGTQSAAGWASCDAGTQRQRAIAAAATSSGQNPAAAAASVREPKAAARPLPA